MARLFVEGEEGHGVEFRRTLLAPLREFGDPSESRAAAGVAASGYLLATPSESLGQITLETGASVGEAVKEAANENSPPELGESLAPRTLVEHATYD